MTNNSIHNLPNLWCNGAVIMRNCKPMLKEDTRLVLTGFYTREHGHITKTTTRIG
jgi:hypothetical protein